MNALLLKSGEEIRTGNRESVSHVVPHIISLVEFIMQKVNPGTRGFSRKGNNSPASHKQMQRLVRFFTQEIMLIYSLNYKLGNAFLLVLCF